MAKKQFNLNPAEGLFDKNLVDKSIPTQQSKTEELAERSQTPVARGTQGRKGHKLPRINMAFSTYNHAYITRRSKECGISITEYVNNLIAADIERNDRRY